jgi:ParB family chromosome partitioning protein
MKIEEIKIGKRMRKDFGNIDDLASSLSRLGQLQPIIITDDGELVAGERRLRAAMSLGWDEVEVIRMSDLDDVTKKEIELEENIMRKEFTWPEEVLALHDLYKLKTEKYGRRVSGTEVDIGYGIKDAAEELEKSLGSVSMDLQLANALYEYPDLAQEKSKAAAFRKYKLLCETALRRELASRTRSQDSIDEDETNHEDENFSEATGSEPDEGASSVRKSAFKGHGLIYYGDSRKILRYLPEASVDCIITDPPFALGLSQAGDGTSGRRLAHSAGAMYDDNPYRVLDMLDAVLEQCARILKPDGHMYIFFHHNRYQDILPMLDKHFEEAVETTPILWIKNTSGIGDPHRSWVYAYEPMFFINRGRSLQKPQAFNYLRYDTVPASQKQHPT